MLYHIISTVLWLHDCTNSLHVNVHFASACAYPRVTLHMYVHTCESACMHVHACVLVHIHRSYVIPLKREGEIVFQKSHLTMAYLVYAFPQNNCLTKIIVCTKCINPLLCTGDLRT